MALWTPTAVATANQGRFFWAGDGATITQVSGEITAWADEFGNTSLTESTNCPAVYTSGGFGSKAVVRAVNGDASGGTAAGSYGRITGSVSDLASETNILVVLAACFSTSSQAWARLISVGSGSGGDWNANGKFNIGPNSTNATVQLTSNFEVLPSGTGEPITSDVPFLVTARFDGTNMYWSFNGGSEISHAVSFSFISSGFLRLFADQDGFELCFGDIRSLQIYKGAAVADSAFIDKTVGWAAWDATDDGSLLPSGHAYKSAAPTIGGSLLLPSSRSFRHLLLR